MRNSLFLIIFMILATACESTYTFNRVVKKSNGDKELLGGVNSEAFTKTPFSDWYQPEYNSYKPNPLMVKEFKSKIKRYRIEAFIGSWCEDTQREFPRFMKILDEAKFPHQRLTIYAVNENLRSFYGEEIGKDIIHVPTFIFYKGGKEVGRIVETPVSENLEQDILMIVKETPLTPNYSED